MEAQLGYWELSVGKTKTKEHTSKEEKMKNKKKFVKMSRGWENEEKKVKVSGPSERFDCRQSVSQSVRLAVRLAGVMNIWICNAAKTMGKRKSEKKKERKKH